jgi:integral membrane protein
MIKTFKVIAFWEGISLILLFFFAMPLKYIWDLPMAVSVVGMAHGVLFLAYVVLAFILNSELNWSLKTLAGVLVASLLPFGTLYMEKKYSDVIYAK